LYSSFVFEKYILNYQIRTKARMSGKIRPPRRIASEMDSIEANLKESATFESLLKERQLAAAKQNLNGLLLEKECVYIPVFSSGRTVSPGLEKCVPRHGYVEDVTGVRFLLVFLIFEAGRGSANAALQMIWDVGGMKAVPLPSNLMTIRLSNTESNKEEVMKLLRVLHISPETEEREKLAKEFSMRLLRKRAEARAEAARKSADLPRRHSYREETKPKHKSW